MEQGLEGQTRAQISKELGGRSIFPDPLHSLLQNAGSVSWLGFHVVFLRGVFIVPAALPPKCIAPTAGRRSSSAVVNPSPGACPAFVISVDCSFVAAQASKQHCHPLGTCLLPLFFALQDLITIVHNRRLLQETSVRVEQSTRRNFRVYALLSTLTLICGGGGV
jgi:hypothetical protein